MNSLFLPVNSGCSPTLTAFRGTECKEAVPEIPGGPATAASLPSPSREAFSAHLCAWCGRAFDRRTKAYVPAIEPAGGWSHGMCLECFSREMAKLKGAVA